MVAVDISPERVVMLIARKCPIVDVELKQFLVKKDLRLSATVDRAAAYKEADFVIVAAPTNYDAQANYFDTSLVERVIQLVISVNTTATIVVKSTVPVGFINRIREDYRHA